MTTPVHSQAHDLRRVIGLSGGTALIVGITIGSGIFRTPPTIAGLVPNPLVISEFLLNLLGMSADASTVQTIAIAAIIILTCANVLGARVGAAVSEVTALVKVTVLAAIILGAFLLGNGSLSHITEGGVVHGGGLAGAVASVIWTYDGWIAVSMIAGEVVAPERLSAIVWGEIHVRNFSPIYGLGIALAGFPVHHLWKRLKRTP